MTEPKWTPGPWRVGDREPYVEVWGRRHMNSYPILASLECEPRKANANLIAAAPDMYEALSALLEQITINDEEGLALFAEPVAAGLAALAKAKGE